MADISSWKYFFVVDAVCCIAVLRLEGGRQTAFTSVQGCQRGDKRTLRRTLGDKLLEALQPFNQHTSDRTTRFSLLMINSISLLCCAVKNMKNRQRAENLLVRLIHNRLFNPEKRVKFCINHQNSSGTS